MSGPGNNVIKDPNGGQESTQWSRVMGIGQLEYLPKWNRSGGKGHMVRFLDCPMVL